MTTLAAVVTAREASIGKPDASERTKQADADRHEILSFLFHDADTQAGIRGTAWAGYQAVTEPVHSRSPSFLSLDDEAGGLGSDWVFPFVPRTEQPGLSGSSR